MSDSMRYAGGQNCPECGLTVGVADRYCRRCGEQLREGNLTERDGGPDDDTER